MSRYCLENVSDADALLLHALEGVRSGVVTLLDPDTMPDVEDRAKVKVVLHSDWSRDVEGAKHVALISGGGSGHEPSHAGFVGSTMLTAAVCGTVFASPSTHAICSAVRAVTGAAGCLLIVKNYTGDILNFRLAQEICRAEGYAVEMCVVADDMALKKCDVMGAGRRGIAGTVFVHKLLGYYAGVRCVPLAELAAMAKHLTEGGFVGSVGVAATSCTRPGVEVSAERVPVGKLELGLGIHGEPGHSVVDAGNLSDVVRSVLSLVLDSSEDRAGYLRCAGKECGGAMKHSVAILINNLGALTQLELGAVRHEVTEQLAACSVHPAIMLSGAFMTALDMRGWSLSILDLSCFDDAAEALLVPVGPAAWVPATRVVALAPKAPFVPPPCPTVDREMAPSSEASTSSSEIDAKFRKALEAAAQTTLAHREELDAIDSVVGDGDCGTTLANASKEVLSILPKLNFASPSQRVTSLLTLSTTIAKVGGSSGALYGFMFAAAANDVRVHPERGLGDVVVSTVERLGQYSGAKPGDRTMMDPLYAVAEAFKKQSASASTAADAAREAADATQAMRARFGRTSYLSVEDQRKNVDPGAKAVAVWVAAAAGQL